MCNRLGNKCQHCYKELDSPHDCILLLKEWVSSECLCQRPVGIMRADTAKFVVQDKLMPTHRSTISDRSINEFYKTAATIVEEPWYLNDACNYLKNWLHQNVNKLPLKPPALNFIWGQLEALSTTPSLVPNGLTFQFAH